jgi:hypothetical protein
MTPEPLAAKEPSVAFTPSFLLPFIHSLKNDKASSEETMFCSLVDTYGVSTAIRASKGFSWSCDRPLQLLRTLRSKS